MDKILFFFVLGLWCVMGQNPCVPLGARIQYGELLISANSDQKIQISFNTYGECGSSFVRILGNSGFQQINCIPNQILASDNMDNFETYVQQCSLTNQISFGETFYYNVFGWSNSSGNDPAQGLITWAELKIVNPKQYIGALNVLVLADWSVIEKTGFTPIAALLRDVMIEKDIHLLMVNGDIAYDLDSNNGTNYIKFLSMAEQFISKIPTVFVPGNHENLSDDDRLLLSQSFKVYNIDQDLVTGFQFGDLYILPFDPYNFVYSKPENISSLSALTAQLAIAQQTGLFTIPFSHYPLVCSGQSLFCQQRLTRMYTYFNAMLDAGVSLYIGAHTHDYQRTYPYFSNRTFQQIESPYSSNQGYLVSIIEGVAGSDTTLITSLPQLNSYTASYTLNQTGFGILTTNLNNQVTYTHYSTKQGVTDSMIIKNYKGENKMKNNLRKQIIKNEK